MFSVIWDNMSEGRDTDPALPRKRKRPIGYENGEAPNEYNETPVSALDFLINSITTRFDLPGYCGLLIEVMTSMSLKEVLEIYQNDISVQNLETLLQILACTVPARLISIAEILSHLSELAPADKELIKEVIN